MSTTAIVLIVVTVVGPPLLAVAACFGSYRKDQALLLKLKRENEEAMDRHKRSMEKLGIR